MNLKEIADKLFEDSKKTPTRGLNAIAEAEKYLQQAYEGRYFFELIQNVRDANKEIDQDGEIFIDLKDRLLSISNTGAEFSPKGIEGITTIGQSTKHSQEYIGFKGIGFKAIKEVTEKPRIITSYGAILFDRKQTVEKYNDEKIIEDQIPLFYFPHFSPIKLTSEEIQKGIVTKIELPLKESVTEKKVVEAFSEIQSKQLILLGNIKYLHFKTENKIISYSIKKDLEKRFIEVNKSDKLIAKFRYFSPKTKVTIPQNIIDSLEGKEKEIFSGGSQVDINIVLELTDNGQFKSIDESKLFLFYPLEINSGFRFIIHSYFIVNPERTALRNSPLNDFLLISIGEFIGKEMLRNLKETRANTNKILCFKRNTDARINILYNSLVDELKKTKFIYDSQTQKYYSHSEVIVAGGFDKGLFPDGTLGGKKLIFADSAEREWLTNEFKIPSLTYLDIAREIENECKRQSKQKKIDFFQNLYNYVNEHDKLNLTGKKVLLTDDWQLISSEEDVFYGGEKKSINLPISIRKHIHFINRDIKFKKTDFREGKSRTGIIEFNTYELVRRLIKLFDKDSVPNIDLLNVIFNLHPVDTKSELDIKEKILFPIKGNDKWVSPLTNPIYFETENLKEIYPNGNFIDESILRRTDEEDIDGVLAKEFLKTFGVWEIPAIYISNKPVKILTNEKRDKIIGGFSGLVSRPYFVRYDRTLDKPEKYNHWFTTVIIENWSFYKSFIISKSLPTLQYYSNQSTYLKNTNDNIAIQICEFVEALSTEKWIVFRGEQEAYSVNEIVGIKYLDFSQPHNQVIGRYLKLLPIQYEAKHDLVDTIDMIHLDRDSIQNFIKLLNRIHKAFENSIPEGKDFVDFYNRILSKLVDFFYSNNQTENVRQLQNEFFLAINDISKKPIWAKANQIVYIDDKPNYDLLPSSIKERVQPHFTNRDKNTFGKIAAKIGKKFSNLIQKKLVESETINSSILPLFFKYLPESIAILESKLDTVLNQHFEMLRTIQVFEHRVLEVEISVGDSEELRIPVNHFVDNDNDYTFHFSTTDSSTKNKQLAESISELFVNLLGRDLRGYNSDLLLFLNFTDKKEYLRNYDILEERIIEIRDKLNTSDLTTEQKFWDAILTAKEISNRENVFDGKEIDINSLSKLLGVEERLIQNMQDNFNFNQTSTIENLNLLIEFLNSISLSLKDLNQIVFPRIDFRDFYEKKLNNLKNKFEKGFEAILHRYLTNQESDEKSTFQDQLDYYKRYLPISIPLNTLEFSIEEFLLELIAERFSFLKITNSDLRKDFSPFNSISIYSANLKLFETKLKGEEFSNDNLDSFLSDNKRRSLLYFDETDLLADDFKNWLLEFKEKNKPTDDESELEDFLREFTNQTQIDIESISTNEVDNPSTTANTLGGGSGKRFDGAANDQFKKSLGLIAEMIVYEKLKTIYDSVTWVSKYASKIYKTHEGYNPEGQDGLGYDIEYIDEDGNKFFVEVKGKADSYNAFEISKNEIDKAHQAKQFYKIFFITQTMNNSQRRIKDLGNIFMLDDGQDFFSNRKFKAIYRNFEIRFDENE